MLGDGLDRGGEAGGLGDTLEDGRQVADRDTLREQALKDPLDTGDGDLARDHVVDQLLLVLGNFGEQLLDLGIGQQLGHIGLEHFGEVGREHRRRIDHGVALEGGLVLERSVDPAGRQAEGRLGGVGPRHVERAAGRIQNHELLGIEHAVSCRDFLDLDDIGIGVELHVVENAHRRHDEAHFAGQLAAQRLDLLGQAVVVAPAGNQRQQAIAKLDPQFVHLQGGRDRLFLRLGRQGGKGGLGGGLGCLGAVAAIGEEGEGAGAAGQRQERNHGNSRQQRHHHHDERRHAERLGVAGELAEQGAVGGAVDTGLGHQEAGGGGDNEGGDLRYQAVADGQQRVHVSGFGDRQAVLADADDHAADDIDEGDQQAGDGIAAHELAGAVHGAKEGRFVLQLAASGARLVLIDEAGGKIGVDGHLLARHGIEGKSCRNLGDAPGTLCDNDEIHDHQDREDDNADDEIAAHDKIAEGLDDVAGGIGALVAVGENEARRGQVEGEPQHGGDEQHRGKGGKFQRGMDEQRGHHDQHRKDDRDRQQAVEDHRRHGQDQHHQDGDDAQGQGDVAALGPCGEPAKGRHAGAPGGNRRGGGVVAHRRT